MFFPIYVAEFEHTESEGSRRWTVVMDAHDADVSTFALAFCNEESLCSVETV